MHPDLTGLVSAGLADVEIAELLGVSTRTVLRWRKRAGLQSRWTPGHGYGDSVRDVDILRHAIRDLDGGNYQQARWRLAVLDLRIRERSAKAQELR